jgi:hypoxanthine phosphoribosyltransferase
MESGGAVPAEWASQVGEVLLGSRAIGARVCELGADISSAYAGRNPVLLVVLKGSFIFAADLSRAVSTEHELHFIRAKSYVGETSSGEVEVTGLDGVDLAGRDVLVVEDIVDTGLTILALMGKLRRLGASSVEACTLLQKETVRRKAETPAVKWVAFRIPDKFVVGYGLDYDQRLRHLPFVGVMKP